jgi:hypothetical protein
MAALKITAPAIIAEAPEGQHGSNYLTESPKDLVLTNV